MLLLPYLCQKHPLVFKMVMGTLPCKFSTYLASRKVT
ncbi:rCG60757 [Rattus norvegicus]|uniref:RCG60757 n=1 Tax=Rattus norvegicus TaxID=10116 RepID=A6JKT3_RAT|nr:rCG60757 [Rattus norvegicus]